jgi:hypothetical protein
MTPTSATSSNRATENIRWSGFETEEMKHLSCSLLFQTDAEYVAQIVDLVSGQSVLHHGCLMLPERSSWGVIKLHTKRRLGVFPASITIGGLCQYTKQDEEDFRMHYLSRKERSHLGLEQTWDLDLPDSRAFCCCPNCAKSQTPGKEYFLVFYPMAQSHITAARAPPVLSTCTMCRLMCVPCLISILQDLEFSSVANGYERYRGPVLNTLERVLSLPVLQRNGIGVNVPTTVAWALNFGYWQKSGLLESLERLNSSESIAASGVHRVPVYDSRNKKRECLVCRKKHSKLVCSNCKLAVYCSRECQKKDWKRHRIADCNQIPLSTSTVHKVNDK